MPTENRSSNTEMVSVPRERLDALWREIQDSSLRSEDPPHVRFAAALLAQPTEQHQGEPVAWLNTATGAITVHPVQVMDWDDESEPVQALYTHADPGALERSWQAGYDTAWYAKNPAEKRTSVNRTDPDEVERLRAALKFYADREHYHFESGNWDTVSGEPLNILWCGDEPDFIEDGSVARAALERQP